MKQFCISIIFWALGFGYIASSIASADDPFQRYIKIKNELPFTVYPVIQSPLADNSDNKADTKVGRLFINQDADGNGVPPGQMVLVNIPKNGVGKHRWYQAQRIFLFSVDPVKLEKRIKDSNVTTKADKPPQPNPCPEEPEGACWTGIANAAYWLDAPAQIIEYTVMSKDWTDNTNGKGVWPDADDTRGVPYLDIDVSYVDDMYMPVSMTLDDTGATKYMGTTINNKQFLQATERFISNKQIQWQIYAAYSVKNWLNNHFHDLVARSPHVPAGYNIINMPLAKDMSALYKAKPGSDTSANCGAWQGCSNLASDNLCCPAGDGMVLDCCGDFKPYLIDGTADSDPWNPSLDAIYARWSRWIDQTPCADISKITSWPSDKPIFNKGAFCTAFQSTVQWVWAEYLKDPTIQNSCLKYLRNKRYNYCVLESIIGYTAGSKAGQHGPKAGQHGPKAGRQPESVQALLRNVPWGDGKPTLQYQWNKFLHYWAPYDSIFNLNPYVTLIKSQDTGINAMSGYSFSIDDQWGNYQDLATGFIVNIGGSSALLNQESFDPYQQYRLSLALGWDHATICGRPVELKKLAQPITFSFWRNGKSILYCDIVVYPNTSNDVFFKYRLVEHKTTVKDEWTGLQHDVKGFKATPQFCDNNSSPSLKDLCSSDRTKLEPKKPSLDNKGLEVVYVSVAENQRPIVSMVMPPPPVELTP